MKNNHIYPTDLTDVQWNCIKDLIPPAKPGGRPRTLCMRTVINAILYLTVTGCQWRMIPSDSPKWQSVYAYFQKFRDDGTWKRIHDRLRAQVRQRAGRHKHPTAGALDSQSVKTVAVSAPVQFRADESAFCPPSAAWSRAPQLPSNEAGKR